MCNVRYDLYRYSKVVILVIVRVNAREDNNGNVICYRQNNVLLDFKCPNAQSMYTVAQNRFNPCCFRYCSATSDVETADMLNINDEMTHKLIIVIYHY